jgi:hypothetical protein
MSMSFKPICREEMGDGFVIRKSLAVWNVASKIGASLYENISHFENPALMAVRAGSPHVPEGVGRRRDLSKS